MAYPAANSQTGNRRTPLPNRIENRRKQIPINIRKHRKVHGDELGDVRWHMLEFSLSAVLAEIKDIRETNQNEDEMVLNASIASKKPMKPHLEFEYPDPYIQRDLYHLIKYSCGEDCTPEQRDKVMKIWTTFLEPVLGVPSHSPNAQDREDPVRADSYMAKSGNKFDGEAGSPSGGTAYRKLYNSTKSSDECISTEHSYSQRVLVAHGNFTVKNECCPGGDIVASKSDIHNDSSMMSVKLWAGKRSGSAEKGSGPSSAREKSINEENMSAKNKALEPECANLDGRTEAISHQESKAGAIIRQSAPSVEPVPEDVKFQACHEAREAHSKLEQEDGELSLCKDLEEKKISASGDTGSTQEQVVLLNLRLGLLAFQLFCMMAVKMREMPMGRSIQEKGSSMC